MKPRRANPGSSATVSGRSGVCEHASEVARAARTGFWPDALLGHTEICPACAQTRTLTTALLGDSARLQSLRPPPAASAVWAEARRRARLHLRHRALFWFRALRAIALIYLPAMLIWAFSHRAAPVREAWNPSFRADFSALLTGPAEIVTVAGALLAAVCITMGTWYLLREARMPLHASPGR